jgi:lipopolysaccharide transport system permease protein
VYTPESGVSNPLRLLKQMFADTFSHRSRDFAWRVFIKNISGMYRQSALGYLWIVIPPLITAFVWVFVNRSKVLTIPSS